MKNRMKFGKNEEAVSPVIGVILMVAITVILAAVIAAFVFGMGPPAKTASASLAISTTSASADNITVNHRGGDVIDLNKVKAIIEQGANRETIALLNATGAQTYGVGDNLIISTSSATAAAKIWLNSAPVNAAGTITSAFDLTTGKVTVTLIDTDSAQQLAKMDATVT